jgi:alpha-glucoside transport system substrate-binding protein
MATIDGPAGPIMAGVWHRMSPLSLMWYSTAIEEYGYELDPTWIGLHWMSDLAVEQGTSPWCIGIESGAISGWVTARWLEAMVLRSSWLYDYDLWAAGALPYNSSQIRTAASYIEEFWFTNSYVLGGRTGIVNTFFADSAGPMFESPPRCWLHMQGSFITAFFPPSAQYGVNYGVYALPAIDDRYGAPMLVSGNIVAPFRDRPEIRAVVEYLTTPQSASGWLASGGAFSPHRTVTLDMYSTGLDRDIAKLVSDASGFLLPASDMRSAGASCVWNGLAAWVGGSLTLEESLSQIDTCVR